MFQTKQSAAAISVISNSTLIFIKVIVGILTGSVSIISEAIHSSIDLLAAIIAFFSVRLSDTPPDEDHPYGHGKIENISGSIEALLILGAALYIIYEAVQRLLHGGELEHLGLGAGVMAVSAIVNTVVSRFLMKTARRTDSLALEADAMHLSTDVMTSVGVFIGLTIVTVTGWTVLDPIIAIGVALIICKAAWDMTRRSSEGLLDTKLPQQEEDEVRRILMEHGKSFVEFHKLRTRKAGSNRLIDLHLVVDDGITVVEAHDVCEHLEMEIERQLPNTNVTIHVEPASDVLAKKQIELE